MVISKMPIQAGSAARQQSSPETSADPELQPLPRTKYMPEYNVIPWPIALNNHYRKTQNKCCQGQQGREHVITGWERKLVQP